MLIKPPETKIDKLLYAFGLAVFVVVTIMVKADNSPESITVVGQVGGSPITPGNPLAIGATADTIEIPAHKTSTSVSVHPSRSQFGGLAPNTYKLDVIGAIGETLQIIEDMNAAPTQRIQIPGDAKTLLIKNTGDTEMTAVRIVFYP